MIPAVQRRLYRHARHAYQAVANRQYATQRRELARLLGTFVRRGDLVFDIGANRGEYTEVLLVLGARVVSVEPNPTLARTLSSRYPAIVEQVAVGSEPGVLPLHLGKDLQHSTLSTEWLRRAPGADRWAPETVDVEVVTFSELVQRHGRPEFVKIDVEGYELEVLRGCDELPRALSFEYQCSDFGVAQNCLSLLHGYEFNALASGETAFRDEWCDDAEMLTRLESRCGVAPSAYGDVYARAT